MERSMMGVVLMAVLACFVQLGCSESEVNEAEKFQEEAGQIYTTVFHKYKKHVRPPDFYPHPVPVEVHATLIHLRGLDILKQELETIIDLDIQWQDKRLAWYANRVVMITEELSEVWHPSLVYLNIALPPSPLFDSKVTITKDGMISWNRREIVTTVCPTEPRNTTQTCEITLGFTSPDNIEVFDNTTTFTIIPDFTNHNWEVDMAEIDSNDPEEVRFALTLAEFDADQQGGIGVNSTGEPSPQNGSSGAGTHTLTVPLWCGWPVLGLAVLLMEHVWAIGV